MNTSNTLVIKHTQEDWDRHFLEIAKLCSKMSKDPSTKVGAAIKGIDKRVISTGYNGFPPEVTDHISKLEHRPTKYSLVIHAEENALRFAENKDLTGCTIYTTLFPCDNCYKLIRARGIRRIVTEQPSEEHNHRWGEKFEVVKKMAKEDGMTIDFVE